MIPIGLSENTVVATHHSIAFLSPLGILKIYSGVQINTPSAFSMLCLKSTTALGGLSEEQLWVEVRKIFQVVEDCHVEVLREGDEIIDRLSLKELRLALPLMARIVFNVLLLDFLPRLYLNTIKMIASTNA